MEFFEETRKISGSGLGLSIAKKIIDAHPGIIKVSSVLGEGSTFTVLLPKINKRK
ncbi:MAG: ATP-binding protein [Acidobacteriota bacterium]